MDTNSIDMELSDNGGINMKGVIRTIAYMLMSALIAGLIASTVTVYLLKTNEGNEVVLSIEEYTELLEAQHIVSVMETIETEFYKDVPDRDTLLAAAIDGMVSKLDDAYAEYYTREEYTEYLESINGEYSGIGVLISQPDENGITVHDVYEENPAAEAGLEIGDIIVAIDDVSVFELTFDEVKNAINGKEGSIVKLSVRREDPETDDVLNLDIEVERGPVNVKYVHHALYNQNTGYVRIDSFSGDCLTEFEEAIRDLRNRNMKSLVIDLRNNPGGSLNTVVGVADILIGEATLITLQGRAEDDVEEFTSNSSKLDIPIAVIVNENSASASELLAAAIQETESGIVVGMTTFGKGIVQTTVPIDDGYAYLKLTTHRYLTPLGNDIHGKGVTPDIIVDLDPEFKVFSIAELARNYQEQDKQLWAALDYVREMAQQQS